MTPTAMARIERKPTEDEVALDHYASISPRIIAAIEKHEDALLELLGRIHEDMGTDLLKATYMNSDEVDELCDEPSGEVHILPDRNAELRKIERLCVAVYTIPFLLQSIPECNGLLKSLNIQGTYDGTAYEHVKRMRRH